MTFTRRLWIMFWPAALAVAALSLLLVLQSDHESQPIPTAIVGLLTGLSFIAAGLFAWSRRPENAVGRLMVAVGFAWFASMLSESNDAWLFSVAGLFDAFFLAVFIHLLLAFPSGRLTTRTERVVVAVTYPTALLANLTTQLLNPDPFRGCDNCPANKFLVADSPAVYTALNAFWDAAGVIIAAAVVAVLVQRRRRASAAARRVLTPVFLSGGATMLLIATGFALDNVPGPAAEIAFLLGGFAFISVPYFFLAGLARSQLARAGVGRLFLDVPENPTSEQVYEAFARALHDPTVRLAHWLPDRETFVDLDGRPFELPPDDPRTWTLVEYEGRRVGAIIHDPSLLHEPELLEAAAATARIGLEKDRLAAELRARLLELERERDFVRTVVDSAPALFAVLTPAGRILRFNDTLARLSGRSDDERTRGRFFWEVLLRPGEADAARAALADPGPQHESAFLGRDGERRTVAWSLTQLLDAQAEPILLLTGTDITERKAAEEELRRSRARIVEAADAERRRLERNLHDGAQQRLVSLSLALRLAQAQLARDPTSAERLLADAQRELAEALADLRELARGIHPAILTDRGLGPALAALAARAPLPVEITAAPEERLPGAVEAAAYYVVAEGLTNVVKYARASGVRVSVERLNGLARVEVADDGIGGADPSSGTGLRGLADRIEALDGRLAVESSPGTGTRLRAEIPV